RRDVGASTRAALDLLQRLNTMFDGDWMMTLAAYNAGEGRIQKAIKANRAHGKPTDYWSLNLPRETALYVPKVLALSEIIRNADRYALNLPHIDKSTALARVNVGQQFDLNTAAQVVGMSVSELQTLNPAYKTLATAPTGPHYLMLPKQKAKQFKKILRENGDDLTVRVVRHKVQAGESLDVLARRYEISALDIKQINELNGAGIRRGQYILLPLSQSEYLAKNNRSGTRSSAQSGDDSRIAKNSVTSSYKVKSGDTLSTIARRHNMSSSELAKLNRISVSSRLKLGQTLKLKGDAPTEIAYRARKGDSLYSIAQRHGVAVDDLVRWNDLSRKSVLKPGTVLTVKVKS
ncbi:MAG: LysM peptidoglycan-binding domain-containing protein, partial [Plesiomonas shigelloides]